MLDAVSLTLLALAAGYAAAMGLLCGWLRRSAPVPNIKSMPTVAVIVAARDEEVHLPRCLDALRAQEAPADRVEIWIADDHSEDRTADIVRRFATPPGAPATDGGLPVRYLAVPDPEGPLRGKALALHTAIKASDAEIVLITDADCAPEPTWVRGMATHLADPTVGLACGLARIETRPGRLGDRVQALDWLLLLGATSALAVAGRPATGMGNNMAVRREAYEATGGYPALPFSVTEDFTLVQAIAKSGRWRIRLPVEPETAVWTLPTETLGEAYVQRRRWARGGLSGGAWVLAAYFVLFLVHLLPLVGLAVAPLAALGTIAVKVGGDAGLLVTTLRRAGDPHPWPTVLRSLVPFEAFLFGYMVTLPVALLLRPRIEWKGRRH